MTERAEVLLVCNAGGHLAQLLALRDAWISLSRVWVVPAASDAGALPEGERVVPAYHPTTRNVPNLLRNLRLAWMVVRRTRPRVLVTTGAGVAVPFVWIARLRGARVVWIESFTRVHSPSLSCRLAARVCDRVYVQWPELVAQVPRSRFVGSVFTDS